MLLHTFDVLLASLLVNCQYV